MRASRGPPGGTPLLARYAAHSLVTTVLMVFTETKSMHSRWCRTTRGPVDGVSLQDPLGNVRRAEGLPGSASRLQVGLGHMVACGSTWPRFKAPVSRSKPLGPATTEPWRTKAPTQRDRPSVVRVQQLQVLSTLFAEFFAPFDHSTCTLSVLCWYSGLGEIHLPV